MRRNSAAAVLPAGAGQVIAKLAQIEMSRGDDAAMPARPSLRRHFDAVDIGLHHRRIVQSPTDSVVEDVSPFSGSVADAIDE